MRLQEVLTKMYFVPSLWTKFEKTHKRSAEAKTDAILSHHYYKKSWYAACLLAYSFAIPELCSITNDIEKTLTFSGSALMDNSLQGAAHSSRSFLPKNSLKTFSLVGTNSDLSAVEKRHYLCSTITTDAVQLIASLPNSVASFPLPGTF